MDGFVDFYRNWNMYKLGFGDVNGEHWLGNDKLALLLRQSKQNELRVDLESFSNERAYATYSSFNVGDESTLYQLSVSGYSGTAGLSLPRARIRCKVEKSYLSTATSNQYE